MSNLLMRLGQGYRVGLSPLEGVVNKGRETQTGSDACRDGASTEVGVVNRDLDD